MFTQTELIIQPIQKLIVFNTPVTKKVYYFQIAI